ncbi:Acyl-CoA synthetase (AMP-forming)/AMP-acid ligase II [Micromonospora pallida]|uniref:Acyl-CoA synthetase (AMP-forming)/AMP-acid ligase II n=1 Tax=Micromonospora pallida TaxID=145854 RepID=A0A1C6RQP0_9ACTN|nr:alpha/beta fold hydrolase [Micromonospora pallida]SCL19345.1 Acyl-CoA synthetase (AMP-forming)/AMP-acid ligase II [Micromonospora pallida]
MLYDAVRAVARRDPQASAVRTTDGDTATYAHLCALADRVGGGLARAGVGDGHVVAVSMDNSIGYVALILAVARLGATYVPMIREFSAEDVRTALDLTGPTVVVADGRRAPLPGTTRVLDLADLLTADPLPDTPGPSHRGRFRLLWTSGSTGFPKMMSWRQDKFVAERRRWIRHTGLTAQDVFFCRHPLDVAHATDLHVFAALLGGGELVLGDPHAGPAEQLRALADSGATVLSALPRHYEQLIEAARQHGDADVSSLRLPFCGGTYVSPQVIRDCDAVLGVRIRQLYGSTEFGLAAVNLTDTVQTDADMSLVRGVSARLDPMPDGGPTTQHAVGESSGAARHAVGESSGAARHAVGELVLRSAYTSEGYLNNPEAHARTFRDGEYWTGDVAQRNADGSYRILGRVSEALAAREGLLLAPMLDEEIQQRCPVRESVTLPVEPSAYGNQVVIVARPAPETARTEVEASIRTVLDGHGLTGPIHLVEALAYTAVGKPHKSLLRRQWVSAPTGEPPEGETVVPADRSANLIRHRRLSRTPTLLFVPGLAMTSAYFDEVAADLSQDHDVVLVDLPGHGGTADPAPGWTIDDAARSVRSVVDRLELRDVTLVGWSLGAGVAWTYLDLFGTDRVSRLVSVEMSPRILADADWTHAAFGGLDAAGAVHTQRAIWADPQGFLDNLVRGSFAAGTEPDPATLQRLMAETRSCSAVSVLALWLDVLTRDWREQLTTTTLPTLLVHGARSQVYPTDVGGWLHEAMPDARLETFAHSGHMPFLEEPEKFTSVLRDFVKETR